MEKPLLLDVSGLTVSFRTDSRRCPRRRRRLLQLREGEILSIVGESAPANP